MDYDMKKAEDVKEYLKNLHIEYKFGCYSEKNPEVCHLLGEFSENIKKDFKKAATIYKSNCDDYNYGRSCAKYGGYLLIGKGCKEDRAEANKYLTKGCDLNDKFGCFHGGALLTSKSFESEVDRTTQIMTSIKMLAKACETHNLEKACFLLSGIYLSGVEGHLEKNLKEAYKISLKCCEQGNPYACANVSQMHARGEGAQKNLDLAETFKKRAETLYYELKTAAPEIKFGQGA